MEGIEIVILLITSLFETFSIFLLVSSFSNWQRKKYVVILSVAVYSLPICCIAMINMYGMSKLLLVICYAAIICYSCWYFNYRFIEGIGYCVVGMILVSIIELVMYIPLNIVLGMTVLGKWLPVLAVILTFIMCYYIHNKELLLLVKTWRIWEGNAKYYILAISGGLFACAIFLYNLNGGMGFVEGFYLIIATVIMMYAICKISICYIEVRRHKEYSQIYGNVVETIQSRQHKFANQLNAIYSMSMLYDNYEDLVEKQGEELGKLEQYMMPNKILILENPLVIAHVYQKMCEAMDKGIHMKMNLSCSLQEVKVPEIFLIEIFGNLLDNAMEEVLQRKLQEIIYLSVFQKENYVYIHVCNEHEKIPYSTYSRFFSVGYSSKGENRGLGLPYVKKIVHKYKGEIEIGNININDKNCFSIKISFPV